MPSFPPILSALGSLPSSSSILRKLPQRFAHRPVLCTFLSMDGRSNNRKSLYGVCCCFRNVKNQPCKVALGLPELTKRHIGSNIADQGRVEPSLPPLQLRHLRPPRMGDPVVWAGNGHKNSARAKGSCHRCLVRAGTEAPVGRTRHIARSIYATKAYTLRIPCSLATEPQNNVARPPFSLSAGCPRNRPRCRTHVEQYLLPNTPRCAKQFRLVRRCS
jgi:hypothetical protein